METALFSPASLFADPDGDSTDQDENVDDPRNFVERRHQFPAMELVIREFSFHQLNANLLWPGTFAFAEWLAQHRSWTEGRRVIELGRSAMRVVFILVCSCTRTCFPCISSVTRLLFLSVVLPLLKAFFDIEVNIAHNCQFNGITPVLPHIKHSWGDAFPIQRPEWDLIIASDILLYVKQYPNLIKTLSFLLKSYKRRAGEAVPFSSELNDTCPLPRPAFLMSWRRRIGKEDESLFFDGCERAGLEVQHLGSRVFSIVPREMN